MKYSSFSFFVLSVASLAFAGDTLKPGRMAFPVRIDSVNSTYTDATHGYVKVRATATFGNRCAVPLTNELIVARALTEKDSGTGTLLELTLLNESHRLCPEIYAPVTLTIDLGKFGTPSEAGFSEVKLNNAHSVPK